VVNLPGIASWVAATTSPVLVTTPSFMEEVLEVRLKMVGVGAADVNIFFTVAWEMVFVCPCGGMHDTMGSGDYWLRHNDYTARGQQGWRWCRKCQVLFFNGNGHFGICPCGGGHDPTGSGAYTLMHVPIY
jgi:hypothetical protein